MFPGGFFKPVLKVYDSLLGEWCLFLIVLNEHLSDFVCLDRLWWLIVCNSLSESNMDLFEFLVICKPFPFMDETERLKELIFESSLMLLILFFPNALKGSNMLPTGQGSL